MTVVVVGAGVAGVGAAIAASRAGAHVTVLDGGGGATTAWTGAAHTATDVAADATAIAGALGVVVASSRLVSTAGYVAAAQGHDAAALNLLALRPQASVGVVRCDRPGWDADAIARALGSGAAPLDATVLRHTGESRLPDADFAALHDDDERLAWLAERLREALARHGADAVLLPPSLGCARARAHELTARVGRPCGEAVGALGGPVAVRFEHARDRALADVAMVRGRATAIERAGDAWRVQTSTGATLPARAVVLATGGLVGGGFEYSPSEAELASVLPPEPRLPFRFTVDAPLVLGAHGKALEIPGSLFGIPPEALAWPFVLDPLLARIGALASSDGKVQAGLYVAGEVAADVPRTWLASLESGLRAGAAAAREAVTSPSARPASLAGAPASRP